MTNSPQSREERLAAKLRENLRRRKAPTRAQTGAQNPTPPPATDPPPPAADPLLQPANPSDDSPALSKTPSNS